MARLPKELAKLERPREPKRARSSYFLWCDDARSAPDAEIEGKSMAVVSKVLSARWKAMSAEDKAPYEARARELKTAFPAAKSSAKERRPALPSGWRASRDATSGAVVYTCIATKVSRWERPGDDDAVAAPPTARKLYEEAERAASRTPGAWKDLTPEERAPYEAAARAARKKA
jgi:HMG (high mobility group) box